MTRYKHPSKKSRIISSSKQTKWAPVFVILKKFGAGKKVHPSMISRKRSWRRTKMKL